MLLCIVFGNFQRIELELGYDLDNKLNKKELQIGGNYEKGNVEFGVKVGREKDTINDRKLNHKFDVSFEIIQ